MKFTPHDDAPGRHERAGEQRVLPAGGAEGLVEAQAGGAHRPQVQQEVVRRRHGPARARRPGLAVEEAPRPQPRAGLGLVVGHDQPGDGGRPGVPAGGQQPPQPAGLRLLVVVDEDEQGPVGRLVQGPFTIRK